MASPVAEPMPREHMTWIADYWEAQDILRSESFAREGRGSLRRSATRIRALAHCMTIIATDWSTYAQAGK